MNEAPAREARVATARDVEAFARFVASRDPHVGDCWHCAGQRMVRAATGKLRRCGECGGTGAARAVLP